MASHPPPPDQEAADPNTPSDASTSDDASPAPVVDADPSPAGIFFKFPSISGYVFNCFADPPRKSFLRVPQPFTICSSSSATTPTTTSTASSIPSSPNPTTSSPSLPQDPTKAAIPQFFQSRRFPLQPSTLSAPSKTPMANTHSTGTTRGRADKWSPCTTREDHISPRRIKNDTGISNDSGTALWLTEDLTAVVAFDVNLDLTRRFDLPTDVQHPRRAQLGKIKEDVMGIVVLHGGGGESKIAVYILDYDGCRWRKYRSLDLITAGFMERTIQPVGSPLLY